MSDKLGPVGQEMETRIRAALDPTTLSVEDQSALHAGHSGARPEGETHFHVEVTSPAFAGLNRVAAQRLVYQSVAELMATRVHALSVKTKAA